MNFKYTLNFCTLLAIILASHTYAAPNDPTIKPKDASVVVGLVNQHCSVCHDAPSPMLMPKKSWPAVIQAMATLAAKQMGHEFITPEVIADITAYYYGSSPATLPTLPYYENAQDGVKFLASDLGYQSNTPLLLNINSVTLNKGNNPEFLVCDGEQSKVSLLTKTGKTWREIKLADVKIPSHTEVVDYDGDGDKDIIVTDLGMFPPSDQLVGRVLLLRQNTKGKFDTEVLLEGIGRTTDARAVDADGDGDLDLAVAAFGGGSVGELAWLENTGEGKHIKHTLLDISGALNISPIDLNADGKIDFVSLISQEHEMIVAFINQGDGQFESKVLSRAPHPMYGSTSMKPVDLDGDGDTDILFTNGDAFDTQTDPKPYHGVQWLENIGNLTFQFHNIGRFYGAATAVAGDIDNDGDMDVVAGSFMNYWEDKRRQSLMWFENDGKQKFTPHNITNNPPGIVSLELKDLTGDGRLDIIAGTFRMDLLMKIMSPPDKKTDAEQPEKNPLKLRFILLENKAVENISH